jgi:DNA-binding MarR family transcriptional regulator
MAASEARRRQNVADDAREILNAVRKLVRALRLFDKEAHSRYGLSTAQLFVLHVLQENEGCSMNELAALTATDQSTASVIVQRLVDAGYVARGTSERDRRHVALKLTAAGRNLMAKSPVPVQERIFQSAEKMKAGDRAQLLALLDALLRGMGVDDIEPAMLFDEEAAPKKASKPRAR